MITKETGFRSSNEMIAEINSPALWGNLIWRRDGNVNVENKKSVWNREKLNPILGIRYAILGHPRVGRLDLGCSYRI